MTERRTRSLLIAAYAILGASLAFTRLALLGHSFWLDEAIFVKQYVRGGPREILTGGLSHELYALIDWATASAFGESEVAFRLWSAVPFIAGVAIVTTWLHRRAGALAGLLFLFLATVSPLLLDVSRQARGYGLAFFFMSVLMVAALEAGSNGRTGAIVAMCTAGVAGTWTLPQFGFAFVATGAVVALNRRARLGVAIGLPLSVAAILLWYAPHLDQVRGASQVAVGTVQIQTAWLATAPIDQILVPALVWLEAPTLEPSFGWLPFVLLAAVVMASSPFLRSWTSALVVLAGPIATVVALWYVDAFVAPRFVSFLLVPLFILLATGASEVLASIPRRHAIVRAAACLVAVGALALHFAVVAPDVVRLPREANRDAAELIEARAGAGTPVLAQLRDPAGLDFYLDRPFRVLTTSEVVPRVCSSKQPLVYVMQPQAITLVDVPCLERAGTEHVRFRQYARGGEINVWFVPPGG